jgi:hypothetical protein
MSRADLTKEVGEDEIRKRIDELSDEQTHDARRQQVDAAIINRKATEQADIEKDIATMSDKALQEFMRKNGFLR